MSEIFLTVLNMSLTASYVILIVMLVRLLLKKAPKVISYALWSVVAFRLVIPFSFESMLSLMPRNTNVVPIPHDIIYQQSPQINSGMEAADSFVGQSLPAPAVGVSANPIQAYVEIGAYIWVLGIIALLVYGAISILILKRQLKSAQLIDQNIYEARNLETPFVLGLINPKIYLPAGLSKEEQSYILVHERIHIHRKDHIIKTLAFLIVSIHWFNPLVWVAFRLMSMDMELSCDERVLKIMNEDIKKPYANLLLSLATGRHVLNGNPLAFGEGDVKGRIKNVLSYKKTNFWVIVFTVIIATVVGIGLIADPAPRSISEESEPSVKGLQKVKNKDDIAKLVEENLEIIMSSPKEASNPQSYIQAHQKEYENIIKLGGEEALRYMLSQFESGNAEGIRGHIMMQLCKEIMGVRNNVNDETLTPQEWYNALSIRQEVKLPEFEYDGSDPIEKLVYDTEIEKHSQPKQGFTIVAPKIFGSYEEEGRLKVFVTTYSATYKLYGNVLELVSAEIVPSAITYKKDSSGSYVLEKYEQAKDGADWQPSIKKFCRMPVSGKEIPGLADKIIDHYGNRDDIHTLHWKNLLKHLMANGIKDATLFNSRGEIEFSMSSPQYIN